MGAGKTVLAHGIALGLGVSEWRGSPTFNLVHEYSGRLPFFHIDAYRITSDEAGDLGLETIMEAGGVAAVEWGSRLKSAFRVLAPSQCIRIHIEDAGDDLRLVEVEQ